MASRKQGRWISGETISSTSRSERPLGPGGFSDGMASSSTMPRSVASSLVRMMILYKY